MNIVKFWRMALRERLLHTNRLFYSLGPELTMAIARCFMMQNENLLYNHGYYEFGLFKGYNLWFAQQFAESLGSDLQYYGFDSFEGMPPNRVHPHWHAGNYAATIDEVLRHYKAHGADMSCIRLSKGWFSEVLPPSESFAPVCLAVIDSDLYESCVPVLKFLRPLLREGSILIFDDWHGYDDDPEQGEQKAFAEFLEANPEIQTVSLFHYKPAGHVVKVLGGV